MQIDDQATGNQVTSDQKEEEEEESTIGSLLQSIVEAQADLDGVDQKGMKRHLTTVLYPLLGQIVRFVGDLGASLLTDGDADDDDRPALNDTDAAFLYEYFEIMIKFVYAWTNEASFRASRGDPSLQLDLQAVHRGTLEAQKLFFPNVNEDNNG